MGSANRQLAQPPSAWPSCQMPPQSRPMRQGNSWFGLGVGVRCLLAHRHLGLFLGSLGLMLASAAQPVAAESLDCGLNGSNPGGPLDVACCSDNALRAYWPERSPQLNRILCQMLLFPTTSGANGEEFSQKIVDGSLSSNSRQASPDTMTMPSLWWNRDLLSPQLGGRRLVQSWISYQIKDSGTAVIDAIVNPQMWAVLTYNERFAVLNQFGTAARDFGYNLRFFQGNTRNYRLVGLYACDFEPSPIPTATLPQPPQETGAAPQPRVNACSANLNATQIVQIQRNLYAAQQRHQQRARVAAATPATSSTTRAPESSR
jgi:hypothetical protein